MLHFNSSVSITARTSTALVAITCARCIYSDRISAVSVSTCTSLCNCRSLFSLCTAATDLFCSSSASTAVIGSVVKLTTCLHDTQQQCYKQSSVYQSALRQQMGYRCCKSSCACSGTATAHPQMSRYTRSGSTTAEVAIITRTSTSSNSSATTHSTSSSSATVNRSRSNSSSGCHAPSQSSHTLQSPGSQLASPYHTVLHVHFHLGLY
jgi:hypothetical protein